MCSVCIWGKIREVRQYIGHSGEMITFEQLNTGVIDVQKRNVQVEILGCKGAKKKKITIWRWGSWVGYLQMAMKCNLLWQLMLKVSEGDMSLQLQWFWQRVTVIGSRELEEKAAKVGIGLGMTSEIYLLERVLRGGAAMVTSELR